MKPRYLFCVLLACCLAGQSAWAHGPRARVGVYYGIGWNPFWYPSPWPYYPPPVIVAPPPAPPPVYVEQVKPAAASAEYWYYCRAQAAYYPVAKDCPEAWIPVLSEPLLPEPLPSPKP
ncbi:hypothetical protein [Azonexus sp.]|uniref:hypothetical protein n=1 Tax=Azonexus sp. TaxID=1872668 RepID=UPI0039E35C38